MDKDKEQEMDMGPKDTSTSSEIVRPGEATFFSIL